MEERDFYKPISEAPADAKSLTAVSTLYDVATKKRDYQLFASLMRLPGKVIAYTNGSFHAYNVNVEYVFKLKKWNPFGSYPAYGKFIQAPDGGEVRDSDIFYLTDADYEFFITQNHLNEMPILDETVALSASLRHPESMKQFSSAADLISYLETEEPRAMNAWALSRKNY